MIIIVTARKAVIKLNRFPWPLKVDVYLCTINDIKDEAETRTNQDGVNGEKCQRYYWRLTDFLTFAGCHERH